MKHKKDNSPSDHSWAVTTSGYKWRCCWDLLLPSPTLMHAARRSSLTALLTYAYVLAVLIPVADNSHRLDIIKIKHTVCIRHNLSACMYTTNKPVPPTSPQRRPPRQQRHASPASRAPT